MQSITACEYCWSCHNGYLSLVTSLSSRVRVELQKNALQNANKRLKQIWHCRHVANVGIMEVRHLSYLSRLAVEARGGRSLSAWSLFKNSEIRNVHM